jgi:hypothetical protein
MLCSDCSPFVAAILADAASRTFLPCCQLYAWFQMSRLVLSPCTFTLPSPSINRPFSPKRAVSPLSTVLQNNTPALEHGGLLHHLDSLHRYHHHSHTFWSVTIINPTSSHQRGWKARCSTCLVQLVSIVPYLRRHFAHHPSAPKMHRSRSQVDPSGFSNMRRVFKWICISLLILAVLYPTTTFLSNKPTTTYPGSVRFPDSAQHRSADHQIDLRPPPKSTAVNLLVEHLSRQEPVSPELNRDSDACETEDGTECHRQALERRLTIAYCGLHPEDPQCHERLVRDNSPEMEDIAAYCRAFPMSRQCYSRTALEPREVGSAPRSYMYHPELPECPKIEDRKWADDFCYPHICVFDPHSPDCRPYDCPDMEDRRLYVPSKCRIDPGAPGCHSPFIKGRQFELPEGYCWGPTYRLPCSSLAWCQRNPQKCHDGLPLLMQRYPPFPVCDLRNPACRPQPQEGRPRPWKRLPRTPLCHSSNEICRPGHPPRELEQPQGVAVKREEKNCGMLFGIFWWSNCDNEGGPAEGIDVGPTARSIAKRQDESCSWIFGIFWWSSCNNEGGPLPTIDDQDEEKLEEERWVETLEWLESQEWQDPFGDDWDRDDLDNTRDLGPTTTTTGSSDPGDLDYSPWHREPAVPQTPKGKPKPPKEAKTVIRTNKTANEAPAGPSPTSPYPSCNKIPEGEVRGHCTDDSKSFETILLYTLLGLICFGILSLAVFIGARRFIRRSSGHLPIESGGVTPAKFSTAPRAADGERGPYGSTRRFDEEAQRPNMTQNNPSAGLDGVNDGWTKWIQNKRGAEVGITPCLLQLI